MPVSRPGLAGPETAPPNGPDISPHRAFLCRDGRRRPPGIRLTEPVRFWYTPLTSHGREWTLFARSEVGSNMAPEEGWVGIEEVAAHLRVAK